MGSKGWMPPPHLRRPPPGPGMGHPEPYGPGMHPLSGPFPHLDMLPPPEIMEQKLAAQHVEMQKLATENQRLAATHGTLRQELAAAQHELQILHAQIGAVKSEREQQMRNLEEKIAKMEADLKAAEPVKLELQQAHTEAQNLVLARDELLSKIHQMSQDLQRVGVEAQQLPALMSELESLRQEYHHCRATYDYEKKFYNDHLESLQAMEKNYMTMAREVEKLRAELTNASSAAGSNENEASGHPMGHSPFGEGYGAHQMHGSFPGAAAGLNATAGTAAYVGAQSGPSAAPIRPGYEAPKGPAYDPSKGTSYDPSRGSGYSSQMAASYNNAQRGPGYDASRGAAAYDAQARVASMQHGQVPPLNNMHYGSGAPARPMSGYEAQARGGNPARR